MPEDQPAALADSPSPFLRHGATQPVNWLAWSEASFARARREARPVLLDIGAVWCHWCHAMDRETDEDPETARLINDLYIPIKVDRDERPDIDARYQRAVQALTGHGGWPLTAFLTPEGEVFYGGTYFPPADTHGRPSFRRVLLEVSRVWREERARAVEAAREIEVHLSELTQEEAAAGPVTAALVEGGVERFTRLFDARHGGFGRAPKFPNPGALQLLLDRYLDYGAEAVHQMLEATLRGMARGGIYDHLGGGFHRYSVDARWLVPHFEKMAYDNGPLLGVYARAAAVHGEPLYRRVAEGIVAYYREVAPELGETGGYPASQDADVGPADDGSYWTWTRGEIEDALGRDERLVRAVALRYGLDDAGAEVHGTPGRRVLHLAAEPAEVAAALGVGPGEAEQLLEEAMRGLRAAREERPRPFVDESRYAGWTALVAAGHIAAARYLGTPDAGESALRALERIWTDGFDVDDGVAHRLGAPGAGGFLEDQAYVAQALLDAFEWTQRPEYLARARQVVEVMLRRHVEPESGALADRPRGEDGAVGLLATPFLPILDAPAPSGNAVAAIVLLRLSYLVEETTYRRHAAAILDAFAGFARAEPLALATYLQAVDWATAPVTTIVVVGERREEAAAALLAAALSTYRPRTVVRHFAPDAISGEVLPPPLRAMVTGEAPRAYLCAGASCAAPVSRAEELTELMRTFQSRSPVSE
jgi:uncharacterized protein YyaL (SSP411 family)